MKKNLILFLLATTFSCSSKKSNVADVSPAKYINTITAADLKTHLTIVASDKMEGRETGSVGQKKAGNYLINQYKANTIPYPKGATDYYQEFQRPI